MFFFETAKMASVVIKLSVVLMLIVVCVANDSPVPEQCLACMCQAASGCKQRHCAGDHCGPYHISWLYWSDAGKPTVNGQSPDAPEAYASCTNDLNCAGITVQRYMKRFARDCNGDNRVDCTDYMKIHKIGVSACEDNVHPGFLNIFNQCMSGKARTVTVVTVQVEIET